jgi:very-short-patch-repair endonuclease
MGKKIRKNLVDVKGKNNPMYGRRGKDAPMYGVHRYGKDAPFWGKHHTLKWKKSLSERMSGRNHPQFGKTGESSPMYGKHLSLKTRKKISKANSGECSSNYGKHFSKNIRKKMSLNHSHYWFGKHHTEMTKKKIGEVSKRRMVEKWKDPKFASKVLSSCHRSPNKLEQMVLSILNSLFPRLFRYVGNGKLFVDGKCPDFVSTDGSMLLIEFNGGYWHRGENTRTRARHFAKYGYKTLFIWQRELKNPKRLKKKIIKFVEEYR